MKYGVDLQQRPKERWCRDCNIALSVDNQYLSCRKRGQHVCRRCWNERFYLAVRKHRYGLTKDGFLLLLQQQTGYCAICGDMMREDRICVDHDHKTGVVRGLLCMHCNSGLGMFKDSPERLSAAIDYLGKRRSNGGVS